jgi:hypothetical protein
MSVEKPPDRADANPHATLAELPTDLFQSEIGPLTDQRQQPLGVRRQR